MDFHHRKLNPLSKWRDIVKAAEDDIKDVEQCRSPPFLPLKHEEDISKSMHLLHKLIIVACAVTAVLIIFVVFNQLRKLKLRRNSTTQRNPSVVFPEQEDLAPEDHDRGPELDHPIWYIHFVGLQQSVIDSITVCKYRNDDGLIEGTDCSICLSEFEENEDLRLLPKCSHAFHIPCIDTWLRSHKNCPLCRAPIIQDPSNTQSEVEIRGSNSNDTIPIQEPQVEVLVQSGSEAIESRIRGVSSAEDGRVDEIPLTNLPDSNMMRCHSRMLSDFALRGVAVEDEVQPVRRSVSMDASSASMIYNNVSKLNPDQAISENFSTRGSPSVKSAGKIAPVAKRASRSLSVCKINSMGRSLQKGPLSLKRSFSSGRKFLSSRHCRSQSSFFPSPM